MKTSRRYFVIKTAMAAAGMTLLRRSGTVFAGSKIDTQGSSEKALAGINRIPLEWTFVSNKAYNNPFNDVSLDVVFTDPQGKQQIIPAFWAGGQVWKVRYGSHSTGQYSYSTICSDTTNISLHGKTGTMNFTPYKGTNMLFQHGPLQVSHDKRHFEHEDGTPFFWLADTWWFALCKRFRWPADFKSLTEDRVKKGYTVVQITSGLNPEASGGGTSPFDPRSMNEAGYPWEENYTSINPQYFDLADQRIRYLVDNGIVPCIVGAWGYHLPAMGIEKMKQYWKYIISRWGSLPVVWCLAGELTMPYWPPRTNNELESLEKQGLTIADRRNQDSAFQKHGWTEVGRYVRKTDPYQRLFTLHNASYSSFRDQIEDPGILDFALLQTGHGDWGTMPASISFLIKEREKTPPMPTLVGEVVYEGLQQHNRQDVVRFSFWTAMLSGAAGHTYGAGGIFEMETRDEPYGRTPDGDWHSYLDEPWDIAAKFPGAQQVAWGKQLFSEFEWWRMEPHPEWVQPNSTKGNIYLPYAAAIPGELYMVYQPMLLFKGGLHQFTSPPISNLDPDVKYEAFWFCPSTGKEESIDEVKVESSGTWIAPCPNEMVDWVLIIAKQGIRNRKLSKAS